MPLVGKKEVHWRSFRIWAIKKIGEILYSRGGFSSENTLKLRECRQLLKLKLKVKLKHANFWTWRSGTGLQTKMEKCWLPIGNSNRSNLIALKWCPLHRQVQPQFHGSVLEPKETWITALISDSEWNLRTGTYDLIEDIRVQEPQDCEQHKRRKMRKVLSQEGS